MPRTTGRASLGGLALRDVNRLHSRSGSSTSPNKTKRRVSFGGSSSTGILSFDFDGGNTSNNLNDVSFSTSSSSMVANEPKKDRRTMLEEWRAKVRAKEANNGNTVLLSGTGSQQVQQPHQQHQYQMQEQDKENQIASASNTQIMDPSSTTSLALPLPPSNIAQGTTAVERFRLRRLQRERMALSNAVTGEESNQGNSSQHAMMPPLPPSDKSAASTSCSTTVASRSTITTDVLSTGVEPYSTSTSVICFDDDIAPSSSSRIGRVGSTPLMNRRMTLSGGAARRRVGKGRKSMLPSSILDGE
jgi:hypothetical protein